MQMFWESLTQMTSMFEGTQPPKTRPKFQSTKRVIWVPGTVYIFIYAHTVDDHPTCCKVIDDTQ